jgi:hypothetical protein
VRHYEPPEVTWLGPELEVGVELECRPLELELELELELPELEDELPELEDDELEEPESEGVGDEPVDVSVLWVEPGRARASAPAVTTLASVTAVVVERTLLRPRSLAATASRIPSRCALLITLILRSGTPNSLYEPSWQPLSSAVRFPSPGVKLPREDEGCLKAA